MIKVMGLNIGFCPELSWWTLKRGTSLPICGLRDHRLCSHISNDSINLSALMVEAALERWEKDLTCCCWH